MTTTTLKIGSQVRVTLKHVQQHGSWYSRYVGKAGIVTTEDNRDEDGERVFGVKFDGGRQWATLTESQMEVTRR